MWLRSIGVNSLAPVVEAAERLAVSLRTPALLITLHRDINDVAGLDGRRLRGSKKQQALRWGIFTLTYSATEAFFNDVLTPTQAGRRLIPLNPDKLRDAGQRRGVDLFTNGWGVRTRTPGMFPGQRPRWRTYVGVTGVRQYLADMKSLRDLLSHGGDPFAATNLSGALWVQNKGNSMTLIGAEGFLQACCDLASQTLLAYGGDLSVFPEWPEPHRSGLSAGARPTLPLLP